MKEFARYSFAIVGVLAAAIVLFLACYGLATILSSGTRFMLLPTDGASFAGWVQAVGSIVAIAAAYFVGADQARRARESALELYRLDKARTAEGCRAIVMRLRGEVSILRRSSTTHTVREFRDDWNRSLSATLNAALQAFDNMPLHEIGSWQAVLLACEIRAEVLRLREAVNSHVARWYPQEAVGDVPLDEVRERSINDAHADLIKLITSANERAGDLFTTFDMTKND